MRVDVPMTHQNLPQRVLVANRGEIAVRIIQACRDLGITPIAVFSTADADALHVRMAGEAIPIGPARAADSYLNVERLVSAAREARADAVHPGYGFLSENAAFAAACEEAGLIFVGPSSAAIAAMGSKVAARQLAAQLGVPLVPGSDGPVETLEVARAVAARIGFPLAIKAAAGGGGRGLKVVTEESALSDAFDAARREGQAYFGNPEVFIERYLARPRHVEVQIIADAYGTVLTLGERDCSIQRNHQKLIEETPANLPADLRREMAAAATSLARAINYSSAGTVEFMVAGDAFYFLEMNTRIQVEHTVTEMVTGLDLVTLQLRIAGGEPLSLRQDDVVFRGHAIQCRVNAEDPTQGFRPAPGLVPIYRPSGGPGVRVDSALYSGYTIPADYDSLIAKIITWDNDRDGARRRMARALDEMVVTGVPTTLPFHRYVMADPAFTGGDVDTGYVGRLDLAALIAVPSGLSLPAGAPQETSTLQPQRQDAAPGRTFAVRVDGQDFMVEVAEVVQQRQARRLPRSARQRRALVPDGSAHSDGVVRSPFAGVVARVAVAEGGAVQSGDTLCVVEAMKMENDVSAPLAGIIRRLHVSAGDAVEVGTVLAEIDPSASDGSLPAIGPSTGA